MVYCAKCGTKNPDDAKVCTQCGASLYPRAEPTRRHERPREKECFGLPHGGAIFGIFIGIIIILWGLTQIFGWEVEIGTFAIIVIGILIVAGAIYGLTRRRS